MVVDAERDDTTNDTAQIEDYPKNTNEATLFLFGGVRDHDHTLSSPEDTSTNTKDSTASNSESALLGVVVVDEGARIESIGKTRYKDSVTRAKQVDEATTKEAENDKGDVESSTSVIRDSLINLTTTTYTLKSVEHTRTAEADQAYQDNLELGRVIELAEIKHRSRNNTQGRGGCSSINRSLK